MPATKQTPKKVSERVTDSRLTEFLHDEIKDIYWAEKHIISTLPKMKKAATSQELKDAFEDHFGVPRTHIERL